ncbi:MAG: hypothetical protein Q9187_001457 [Circinaria calcarea]
MYDPARDKFTAQSEDKSSPLSAQDQNTKRAPSPDNSAIQSKKQLQSPEQGQKRPRKRQRTPDAVEKGSNKRQRTPEAEAHSNKHQQTPEKSPVRQRKRPGGASRINNAEKEAVRQRQLEREKEKLKEATKAAAIRGVHDVVRQHYNAVPQRGRDWRRTDSRIRGLRNFNNWVKSTLIQKFSPNDDFTPRESPGLLVLDIGCGKGGDLGKWQKAPQPVDLYVGVDPADISIQQARDRHAEMRRGRQRVFQGEFFAKDGYGEWLGEIPLVRDVGIDGNVGPGGGGSSRWGGGGFDIVTMMFCMHYAFESEVKARGMLRNVAGSLKKGGRFMGVIPNSDILRAKVEDFHKKQAAVNTNGNSTKDEDKPTKPENTENGEVGEPAVPEWGNSIYRVRFPGKTPSDGIFRPPFGWKYSYWMEEAVEEIPEYVVPWEAFRA